MSWLVLCLAIKLECDIYVHIICDRPVHATSTFLFSQYYLQCAKNGLPQFQLIVVSSSRVVALNSKKNKEINLCSKCTYMYENKLSC